MLSVVLLVLYIYGALLSLAGSLREKPFFSFFFLAFLSLVWLTKTLPFQKLALKITEKEKEGLFLDTVCSTACFRVILLA